MEQRQVGTWTLALGLIGSGVILILHYLGLLEWTVFQYVFPSLVIIFGVEITLTRVLQPDRKMRLNGWNIVFLLIVAAGLFLTSIPGITFGPGYLSPVQGQVAIDNSIKNVRIELPDTKVIVTGRDDATLAYQGELRVDGTSQTEADKRLKELWKAEKSGDTLTLELERSSYPEIHIGWSGPGSTMNVKLPRGLIAKVHTSNGSIACSGTQGTIDLHTSNGAIRLQDVGGDATADSSNGSITAEHIQGSLQAHTSNGSMTLQQIGGALHADSSNGRITVDSGVNGDWTLHTSNAGMDLTVPPQTNARVQADTSNGSVGGNAAWSKDDRNHGTLVLGDGSHNVTAKTSNGSISLNVTQ